MYKFIYQWLISCVVKFIILILIEISIIFQSPSENSRLEGLCYTIIYYFWTQSTFLDKELYQNAQNGGSTYYYSMLSPPGVFLFWCVTCFMKANVCKS